MRLIGFVNLILCAALVSSCQVGCCRQHLSELCDPIQLFYGHEAMYWRYGPSNGSQWRHMHYGPQMRALVPQEKRVLPSPHVAEPAPVGSKLPNVICDEALQDNQQPQSAAPVTSDYTGQAPKEFSATPDADGKVEPAVPQVPQAAPAQPMPEVPISNKGAQPMANWGNGPQLEFQPWPAFTALEEKPAQRQETAPTEVEPLPAAAQSPLPAVAKKPLQAVAEKSLPGVGAPPKPFAEAQSRWRLVVHDNPDVLPTTTSAEALRFRPPLHDGSQPAAVPKPQAPAAKPTLEEQTGNALRLFISDETQPGKE